jgi:hypothetical protein
LVVLASVPHFRFNLLEGSDARDGKTISLPTLQSAYCYAMKYAGDCIDARPELLRDGQAVHVEVGDIDGNTLFVVTASVTEMTNTVLV